MVVVKKMIFYAPYSKWRSPLKSPYKDAVYQIVQLSTSENWNFKS